MRNLVLRLGELAIPVGLAATVAEPDEKLFRVLHADCKTPISMRVYCPLDERVLEPDETLTAWQVAPGQFIPLDADELAALRPEDSALVRISGFTSSGQLDALLVKKRYHLAPAKALIGRRAYRALAEAMRDLDVVALARFTAWQTEQIAAINSRGNALELATLNFFDDVVQADETAAAIAAVELGADDGELMREVVERYTRTLKPDDLASLQRPRVRKLLEAKLAGEPIVGPDARQEETPAEAADLGDALRRTLKAAPRRRSTKKRSAVTA
jgi:DNA end-binding protein Ku